MGEGLRQSLLRDVDTKVSSKVEELWQRGRLLIAQEQQKQQDKFDRLCAEIGRCVERQCALEAENEQLRLIVAGIAGRLSPLGSPLTGNCGAGHPPASPAMSPQCGGTGPLPPLPPFPFPAGPLGPPGPALSLARALGSDAPAQQPVTPPRQPPASPTPLSLASSLPAPETVHVFSFALRKADGTDLGLDLSGHDPALGLTVEQVRSEGAVEAWNRQCACGAFPERAIVRGDRIVCVNGVSGNPQAMLEECKQKQLLRLTVARGEPAMASHPHRPSGLRADASEFVPLARSSGAAAQPES